MTIHRRPRNVKYMWRLIFAITLGSSAPVAAAQDVPGRDLLDFPIGALAEPVTMARLAGDGLHNPATIVLPERARLRFSAVALTTPADQGVGAQLLAAAGRIPGDLTVGLSIARAEVDEILRTQSDPQTIGQEVAYSTTLMSASVAQRRNGFSLGISARYRLGQADRLSRGAFLLDGGIVAHRLFGRDLNAGFSSFLWRPGDADRERTALSAAADAKVAGPDSVRQARLGYAITVLAAQETEHYGYAAGRYGRWEGRVGVARQQVYDVHDWRLRLGLGLRYARYVIGIAREENGAGLPPYYQFALSAIVE